MEEYFNINKLQNKYNFIYKYRNIVVLCNHVKMNIGQVRKFLGINVDCKPKMDYL